VAWAGYTPCYPIGSFSQFRALRAARIAAVTRCAHRVTPRTRTRAHLHAHVARASPCSGGDCHTLHTPVAHTVTTHLESFISWQAVVGGGQTGNSFQLSRLHGCPVAHVADTRYALPIAHARTRCARTQLHTFAHTLHTHLGRGQLHCTRFPHARTALCVAHVYARVRLCGQSHAHALRTHAFTHVARSAHITPHTPPIDLWPSAVVYVYTLDLLLPFTLHVGLPLYVFTFTHTHTHVWTDLSVDSVHTHCCYTAHVTHTDSSLLHTLHPRCTHTLHCSEFPGVRQTWCWNCRQLHTPDSWSHPTHVAHTHYYPHCTHTHTHTHTPYPHTPAFIELSPTHIHPTHTHTHTPPFTHTQPPFHTRAHPRCAVARTPHACALRVHHARAFGTQVTCATHGLRTNC